MCQRLGRSTQAGKASLQCPCTPDPSCGQCWRVSRKHSSQDVDLGIYSSIQWQPGISCRECQRDVKPCYQVNPPHSTHAGQCNTPLDFELSAYLGNNIFSANEL